MIFVHLLVKGSPQHFSKQLKSLGFGDVEYGWTYEYEGIWYDFNADNDLGNYEIELRGDPEKVGKTPSFTIKPTENPNEWVMISHGLVLTKFEVLEYYPCFEAKIFEAIEKAIGYTRLLPGELIKHNGDSLKVEIIKHGDMCYDDKTIKITFKKRTKH